MYIVHWNINGVSGHGKRALPYFQAVAWVKTLNAHHGAGTHWLELAGGL